jgi:hypothetical protein
MNDVDAIRDRLAADIEAAFRDVERGDGTSLREANLEGFGTEADVRKARKLDADQSWWDIAALCFMDPEGFRYYLPAFMRFALLRYRDSTSVAVDSPIYALEWSDLGRKRFKRFTKEQSKVICRFLRFMAEHTDGEVDDEKARKALVLHWDRFCEDAGA